MKHVENNNGIPLLTLQNLKQLLLCFSSSIISEKTKKKSSENLTCVDFFSQNGKFTPFCA